jgi:hypothetical protein
MSSLDQGAGCGDLPADVCLNEPLRGCGFDRPNEPELLGLAADRIKTVYALVLPSRRHGKTNRPI